MAAERGLTELQERKRLLVLKADLHRALVGAECATLRARLNWLSQAREKVRSASPWLAVGLAFAGLLAARDWRRPARWLPGALAVWRAVQGIKSSLQEPGYRSSRSDRQ